MPICARKSPYLHPGPKRGHLSTPRRSCAYGHGNGQNGPISGLPPGRVQRSLTRVHSPGQNDCPGPGQRSRTADPPKVAPGPPDKSRPGCEMDPGKNPPGGIGCKGPRTDGGRTVPGPQNKVKMLLLYLVLL